MVGVSLVDSDLLTRVRLEYVQMLGLRLTSRQAQRLWNLTASVCDELLAMLVQRHRLSSTVGPDARPSRDNNFEESQSEQPDDQYEIEQEPPTELDPGFVPVPVQSRTSRTVGETNTPSSNTIGTSPIH